MNEDRDWVIRLNSWTVALKQLGRHLDCEELNELEKHGVVHVFKCNHELACKTIASFFYCQGTTNLHDFKDMTRTAFSKGLIDDGETWMAMIKSRERCEFAYEEETLNQIVDATANDYYPSFITLHDRMSGLR